MKFKNLLTAASVDRSYTYCGQIYTCFNSTKPSQAATGNQAMSRMQFQQCQHEAT
jgi:hypothetical protein